MHEWLQGAATRLAAEVGDDPAGYQLGDGDIERLLDLARIAAHDSGDRTNAPLLAYLVGLAHGRHPGQVLSALSDGATGRAMS